MSYGQNKCWTWRSGIKFKRLKKYTSGVDETKFRGLKMFPGGCNQ